jgi:hypothetical protein
MYAIVPLPKQITEQEGVLTLTFPFTLATQGEVTLPLACCAVISRRCN